MVFMISFLIYLYFDRSYIKNNDNDNYASEQDENMGDV